MEGAGVTPLAARSGHHLRGTVPLGALEFPGATRWLPALSAAITVGPMAAAGINKYERSKVHPADSDPNVRTRNHLPPALLIQYQANRGDRPIPDLVADLNLAGIGFSLVTFVLGLLAGLYIDDYREDRNWCRNVDVVLADIRTAVDTIQTTGQQQQDELQTQADRLDTLIQNTPPYRHSLRRDLESLYEDVDRLAGIDQFGPPTYDYDFDDEPDDQGDLNRIDYIIDEATAIKAQVDAVDQQLSYGLFALLPRFLYYNAVPARLR